MNLAFSLIHYHTTLPSKKVCLGKTTTLLMILHSPHDNTASYLHALTRIALEIYTPDHAQIAPDLNLKLHIVARRSGGLARRTAFESFKSLGGFFQDGVSDLHSALDFLPGRRPSECLSTVDHLEHRYGASASTS